MALFAQIKKTRGKFVVLKVIDISKEKVDSGDVITKPRNGKAWFVPMSIDNQSSRGFDPEIHREAPPEDEITATQVVRTYRRIDKPGAKEIIAAREAATVRERIRGAIPSQEEKHVLGRVLLAVARRLAQLDDVDDPDQRLGVTEEDLAFLEKGINQRDKIIPK